MSPLLAQLDEVIPTVLTGSIVRTAGLAAAVAGFPAPNARVPRLTRKDLAEFVTFR